MGQKVIHVGSGTPDLQTVTDEGKITTNVIEVAGVDYSIQASAPPYKAGRMFYDGQDFRLYDDIPNTSISIGKEQVVDVYNDTGVTALNFSVVRFDSVIAGTPTFVLSLADTVAHATSLVVLTHDILDGEIGKATNFGLAGGDTSAWEVGDLLFPDSTIAGLMTNIEQPILSPVARVLVKDALDGVILINPRGVQNVTAIGQANAITGLSDTIDATPSPLAIYGPNKFEKNVDVILTPTGGNYTATMSPASIGVSGFYRVSFSISISGTANTIYHFEIYKNSVATGVVAVVDLTNNNIDAGSASISVIVEAGLLYSDVLEIYTYTESGTATITEHSVIFNIERIGTV